MPRVAAGPLTTTVVGSYPQPDWLIDRARLGDRLPPRVRAREPARIRKALEVVPPERLVVAPDMPDAALADEIRARLRDVLVVQTHVELVPFGSLGRSE